MPGRKYVEYSVGLFEDLELIVESLYADPGDVDWHAGSSY